MRERWKDIEGYEGLYQVSDYGKVKSLRYDKLLKFSTNGKGYLQVQFTVNYKFKTIKVHTLVAKAFVKGYRPGLTVNHRDGNKKNNYYKNLEWKTSAQNLAHAIKNKLVRYANGEDTARSKLTEKQVLQIRKLNKPVKELAILFNVTKPNIRYILKRKTWKHL